MYPDMAKPALHYITPTLQHYMGLTMLHGAFTESPFLDFVQCLWLFYKHIVLEVGSVFDFR